MSADDASLFYAQDSGIFRTHGLNVAFVAQASPVAVEASMASGQEQFGFVTTPVLINLNSKSVRVECVSSVDGGEPSDPANDSTVLVAAKGSGITSVAALAQGRVQAAVDVAPFVATARTSARRWTSRSRTPRPTSRS